MLELAASATDWAPPLADRGRVQVRDVLTPSSAEKLGDALKSQQQWNLVFNQGGKHVDVGADSVARFDEEQRRTFFEIVHGQAATEFQYLYKSVPIYDVYHQRLLPGHFFNALFEFLNGEAFLAFARELVAEPDIGFCDAQATCYSAGHFLTAHDDAVKGSNRVAAYVLNMTPTWRPDWGGALQFYDERGNIVEGFMPCMNTLNVFTIPQRHAVSLVAPFARADRFSVTGWFRPGRDPKGAPSTV